MRGVLGLCVLRLYHQDAAITLRMVKYVDQSQGLGVPLWRLLRGKNQSPVGTAVEQIVRLHLEEPIQVRLYYRSSLLAKLRQYLYAPLSVYWAL